MEPQGVSRRRFVAAAGLSIPLLAGGRSEAFARPAAERAARPDSAQVAPPTVLPAVQRFETGRTAERLSPATRIVLHPESARALRAVAEVLAEELVVEGHVDRTPRTAVSRHPKPHDIVLELAPVDGAGTHPEAYSVVVDRAVTVTSPTDTGVFWGTRTLVQMLRNGLPHGRVVDWPELTERSLLLDIGRKYFTPDWIKTLIREMSFLKMNALQLHLSEGLGFGVQSDTHPEITSQQHLSKAEVREILAYAKRYHVDINADVDTPGHMEHILAHHPEFQLVLADGTRHPGFLDFSMPGARQLAHEIVSEMCDLFDGPVFHLGGDEFFPAPWQGTGPDVISDRTAPQLVRYARGVNGKETATAHDGYEYYMNELADIVRAKGKVPRMFNDDIYPGEGVNRVDPGTQADVWIRWNTEKPHAGEYVDAGHQVINANGDYLYFILTSTGVGEGPHKNPKGIYERWTPRTFMGSAGSAGDYLLPETKPVFGAHLSVWCDSPESMQQDEVAHLLQEWLQVFAQQTWGSPKPVPTLRELRVKVLDRVGTAPRALSA
ncbi:family 20 glycosylhydrolase [Streptomyces sp. NPDC002790]|uniref:family 20 glycosylhydrolase n=1 Tax=Streptomyces sp. NPDC002790 TaxID=3154431 RepID=UPI00331DD701